MIIYTVHQNGIKFSIRNESGRMQFIQFYPSWKEVMIWEPKQEVNVRVRVDNSIYLPR